MTKKGQEIFAQKLKRKRTSTLTGGKRFVGRGPYQRFEQRTPRWREFKHPETDKLIALGPDFTAEQVQQVLVQTLGAWRRCPERVTPVVRQLDGYPELLIAVLRYLREHGIKLDIFIFNAAVSSAQTEAELNSILDILEEEMQTKTLNFVPGKADQKAATAAISASEIAYGWQEALQMFHKAGRQQVARDEVTYVTVANAAATDGDWQIALEVLDLMRDQKFPENSYSNTVAVTSWSKGSHWERALEIFWAEIRTIPKAIQVRKWTNACVAASRGKQWQHVLALLSEMSTEKVEPGKVCLTVAMSACQRENQYAHAKSIMRLMEAKRFEVSKDNHEKIMSDASQHFMLDMEDSAQAWSW